MEAPKVFQTKSRRTRKETAVRVSNGRAALTVKKTATATIIHQSGMGLEALAARVRNSSAASRATSALKAVISQGMSK